MSGLTLAELNRELKQQLSQDTTLVLMQPKGEPEVNVKALQEIYNGIMAPQTVAEEEVAPAEAVETAPVMPTTAQ